MILYHVNVLHLDLYKVLLQHTARPTQLRPAIHSELRLTKFPSPTDGSCLLWHHHHHHYGANPS